MNRPKIQFGAIKLNVASSTSTDKKDDEPKTSGELKFQIKINVQMYFSSKTFNNVKCLYYFRIWSIQQSD